MNSTDAACSACGNPTTYNGRLPILCNNCRESRELIQAKLATGESLGLTPEVTERLMRPDAELVR